MSSKQFDKAINPYKMLNVPENYNLEMLKTAYKKAAFTAHPDKGGSEYLFNIVTDCYKYLAKELKKKENDKLHHELKKEAESVHPKTSTSTQGMFYTGSRFDQKKFNKFFDDNKFKEEIDNIGYEQWMAKNNIKTTPKFKGGDISRFNEHFEKNVKLTNQQKQLIKWQEPQPIIASNKCVYIVSLDTTNQD